MECHRGFKREIKLIKHVTKRHSKVSKTTTSSDESIKIEAKVTHHHVEGSLKLTPMGCPDCTLIFQYEDEMLAHFSKHPHERPPMGKYLKKLKNKIRIFF
jgi:uncharacterized C2H2 Zn-finger protein